MSEEFTTLPECHDRGQRDINEDIVAALREHDAEPGDITMHGRHEPAESESYLEYMTDDGPATWRESDRSSQDAGEKAASDTADDASEGAGNEITSEADDDEELAAQPPVVREMLASLRQQFDAKLEQESGSPAEHGGATETFDAALAPFRPYLASLGVTPGQAAQRLLSAEYRLRNGTTEQKTQMLAQLARDYGINVNEMAHAPEPEPLSPELARLSQRLGGIEQAIWADRQRLAQQVQVEAQSVVDTFAAERDSSGRLKHPHFEQVRDRMATLMASFPEMTIEQAYDSAAWSNPAVRREILAKEQRPTAARKSAKKSKAKQPNLSLRDELQRQLKLANERASA